MEPEPLSDRLLRLRWERGLSQNRAARLIGVTQSAVVQWEKGRRRPEWESIPAIAAAYGVSEYLIVHGEDDPRLARYEALVAALRENRIYSYLNQLVGEVA